MTSFSADRARESLWRMDNPALWAAIFVVFFGVSAIHIGTDATWDFRNYHYYNGFSVHHDRSRDILPAQAQTALYRGLDGVYYLLFAALNERPYVLSAVMSLPYAAAALSVFLIARLFVEGAPVWRAVLPAAAALVGLKGVASWSTLNTTMSDVVPGVPLLAGLAWWLIREKKGTNGIGSALILGLLGGASVGLKLTQAPLFLGVGLAFCVRAAWRGRISLAEAVAFGGAGAVAFAALDASWLLGNWGRYGNPIFPLHNELFRSALVAPDSWADLRFMPKSIFMAVFYPAYWAFRPSNLVAELSFRDPRILLACIGALAILATACLRRAGGSKLTEKEKLALFLAVSILSAYVVWEKLSSIYRYLSIEEALSGALVLAALVVVATRRTWIAYGLFAVVCVGIVLGTREISWGRLKRSPVAVAVNLPPIEPDAMLLMLDSSPMGYVAAFLPDTAPAIGTFNNITHPGAPGTLSTLVATAVRNHPGPLWGLEDPANAQGTADRALGALSLVRDRCEALNSNLEHDRTVQICKLKRVTPNADPAGGSPG